MIDVRQAARRLLAGRPGDGNSARQVAERAADACKHLATHLSRLLGATGVDMLLQRSVVIASAQFPWLQTQPAATSEQPDTRYSALRHAMEQQKPAAITDAFAEMLSTFVALLTRLIGEGLVERLLNEVWPAMFVPAVKDNP